MKDEKNRKSFIECFSDFMGDPEGLTREELVAALEEQGIDTAQLEKRGAEVVRRGSAERRLAWLKQAREKRAEIEKILDSKQIVRGALDLKNKIKEVLRGTCGPQALSYAEARFRKKEDLTETDMETLLQDLEDLNLLKQLNEQKEED